MPVYTRLIDILIENVKKNINKTILLIGRITRKSLIAKANITRILT